MVNCNQRTVPEKLSLKNSGVFSLTCAWGHTTPRVTWRFDSQPVYPVLLGNLFCVSYAVRRPCNDFMDILWRLTSCHIIIIIIMAHKLWTDSMSVCRYKMNCKNSSHSLVTNCWAFLQCSEHLSLWPQMSVVKWWYLHTGYWTTVWKYSRQQ